MKNKFNASKTRYDNYSYDSGLEAKKATDLDYLKKANEIEDWQRQFKWYLYVNGKRICQYTIDFRVVNNDGTIDYIEMKGAEDYAFTVRWKLVQALFRELTAGENARLYKNSQLVMSNFDKD